MKQKLYIAAAYATIVVRVLLGIPVTLLVVLLAVIDRVSITAGIRADLADHNTTEWARREVCDDLYDLYMHFSDPYA